MDKSIMVKLDPEWRDLISKALEAGMTAEAIRDFFRDHIKNGPNKNATQVIEKN